MKKLNPLYRIILFFIIIFLNIGCDQTTKKVAQTHLTFGDEIAYLRGIFKLMYAENKGAFLSLGEDLPETIKTLVLIIIPTLLLVFLMRYIFFSKYTELPQAISFSFILGGGLSNVFDRIVNGKVVDFMNLSYGNVQTGIFNMADVAIMFGMVWLVAHGIWRTAYGDKVGI